MTRSFQNNHRKQDAAVLPCATRDRWQPIRGGLLNLYLYDYEEFRYEHGHLILRGNNGTGKSRVLALQLPFLFDGHLAPSRVEPDADPSKRMEWNLLMGRHNERLGYTWIEFGCISEPGTNGKPRESPGGATGLPGSNGDGREHKKELGQVFITLGCGLSATKGSGMRDPWFFITDQRVGEELFLQSDAGHALSKSALVEAIGNRGRVYTTAKDYRQAVDEKLFGLGRQRYDAMVDLLIQLRKPQLSRQLDEKMLAGVLGEALPPPSEQMIVDVAESFRGLETDRMELTRFRSACDGVDSFLKTYRNYASIASRRRAADVRQSHSRYESANKELRQGAQLAPRSSIADLGCPRSVRSCEEPSVGAVRQGPYLGLMVAQYGQLLPRRGIPQPDGCIGAGRGEALTRGVKRNGPYIGAVSDEGSQLPAGKSVPQSRRTACADAGHQFPAWAKGQAVNCLGVPGQDNLFILIDKQKTPC
jgi:hypothetical protein